MADGSAGKNELRCSKRWTRHDERTRYSRPEAGIRTSSRHPSGRSGEPSERVARTRLAGGDGACCRSTTGAGELLSACLNAYLRMGSSKLHVARGRLPEGEGVVGMLHVCKMSHARCCFARGTSSNTGGASGALCSVCQQGEGKGGKP